MCNHPSEKKRWPNFVALMGLHSHISSSKLMIIDCGALAKQGDNALGSVRLSVRLHSLGCVSVIRGIYG